MTITLSPDVERALAKEAARRGTTPDELAEETLRVRFAVPVGHVGPRGEELRAQINAPQAPVPELSAEEKEARRQEALARIHSGYYVSRLSSSEEFSARKAEEKALEERRWHK
jgi:hypothetical protein